MYERLKELKFFNPGDEASELFSMTCSLAYKMNGIGDSQKAELLFEWAKEMSIGSRNWCEENELDLDDFITGTDPF